MLNAVHVKPNVGVHIVENADDEICLTDSGRERCCTVGYVVSISAAINASTKYAELPASGQNLHDAARSDGCKTRGLAYADKGARRSDETRRGGDNVRSDPSHHRHGSRIADKGLVYGKGDAMDE